MSGRLIILPKKKWHVRTKENIARVRRDEAKAAEDERLREKRAHLAEQEARTSFLRSKARDKLTDAQRAELDALEGGSADVSGDQRAVAADADAEKNNISKSGGFAEGEHVNLFKDLEAGDASHTGNAEHEEEKKREQEEYEKKIGLLTYFAQDTEELTGEKSWWLKIPEKRQAADALAAEAEAEAGVGPKAVKAAKLKDSYDPLHEIHKYIGAQSASAAAKPQPTTIAKSKPSAERKKKKKRRRRSSSSSSSASEAAAAEQRKPSKSKRSKRKKSKKKKKHRSSKRRRRRSSSSSSSSSESSGAERLERERKRKLVDKLRVERLERERSERRRADKLLAGGDEKERLEAEAAAAAAAQQTQRQKYNSQFNPDMARQNKLDAKKKYWLD